MVEWSIYPHPQKLGNIGFIRNIPNAIIQVLFTILFLVWVSLHRSVSCLSGNHMSALHCGVVLSCLLLTWAITWLYVPCLTTELSSFFPNSVVTERYNYGARTHPSLHVWARIRAKDESDIEEEPGVCHSCIPSLPDTWSAGTCKLVLRCLRDILFLFCLFFKFHFNILNLYMNEEDEVFGPVIHLE